VRTLKSVYKTHVDAVHFRLVDQTPPAAATGSDPTNNTTTATTDAAAMEGQEGEGVNGGGLGNRGDGRSDAVPQFSAARVRQFHEFVEDGQVHSPAPSSLLCAVRAPVVTAASWQ
jgi:hypothetical protein